MAQFMLMLQEKATDFSDVSPEEMQRIIEEYGAWRSKLEQKGRLVAGHKLKDEGGRQMSVSPNGVQVVDGPFTESKEVVGGYFIIEASDYDEAVEICGDCPHLKYGERIDIRQIDLIEG